VIRFAGIALLAALAAGCTSTGIVPAESPKTGCEPAADEFSLVTDVLARVNDVRAEHDLAPLRLDPLLSAVADEYACEMIDGDFLAHANPSNQLTPGERLTSAGYIYYAMGENIAAGQTSAEEVVSDWLASELHRQNILSPDWREIGIAVRRGGEYGWYWVQEFADPVEFASSAPAANADLPAAAPARAATPQTATAQ